MDEGGEKIFHRQSNSPKRPYDHVDLVVGDDLAGRAKIRYENDPIPLCWVHDLRVRSRGEGRGSKLMSFIEEEVKRTNRVGLLLNNIAENNIASGMYEKRGWRKIPGTKDGYAYNVPENFDIRGFSNLFE